MKIEIEHDIRARQTVVGFLPKGKMRLIDENHVSNVVKAGTGVLLHLDYEDLQALIDELWRTGHRPSEGVLSPAEAVRSGKTPSPGPVGTPPPLGTAV